MSQIAGALAVTLCDPYAGGADFFEGRENIPLGLDENDLLLWRWAYSHTMLKQWMLEKALISSKKTNEIRRLKLLFYILTYSFRTYRQRSRAKAWIWVG